LLGLGKQFFMYIWLITIGEPLPMDSNNERLYRTGILANWLIKKNHQVLWWTSTFDHTRKKQRFDDDHTIILNDHFHIKLLHSISYRKNVSFRRIANHYGIARKFKRLAQFEVKPEIILCSFPTIELSLAATEFGKNNHVPVVLDVRDLWPDMFLDVMPEKTRKLMKLFLRPMIRNTRTAFSNAAAVFGNTPSFVDWGIRYGKRDRNSFDRDFPFGYTSKKPTEGEIKKAKEYWKTFGIDEKCKEYIVCFFGTIGRQFDFQTIIIASKRLKMQGIPIRFVLCGDGDNLTVYKEMANGCDNIVFPGWVGKSEIWTLMRLSSIGLAPYINTMNFTMNLTNKPIEYLSGGLPILSSLKGTVDNMITENRCGFTYSNVDNIVCILAKWYKSPKLLKDMSQNAYNLFERKFVAENVYSNMIEHLESICNDY
jgi:glycosyltransferase involved in cell wall biosynthesis